MKKPEKKIGYRVEEFDGDVIAKQCAYLGQAKFIQGYNESHTEQEAYREDLLGDLKHIWTKGKEKGIKPTQMVMISFYLLEKISKELGWKA